MSDTPSLQWRTLAHEGKTEYFHDEAACRARAEDIARETDNNVLIEMWEDDRWWMVDKVGTGVKYPDWEAPQDIVLGDYVRTQHYGYRGRVYKVHPGYPAGFGCPEDEQWLRGQAIPVMQYKNERWLSILVHEDGHGGGGSVVAPAALCERIDPFPFKHRYANQYFRADEPFVSEADKRGEDWTDD